MVKTFYYQTFYENFFCSVLQSRCFVDSAPAKITALYLNIHIGQDTHGLAFWFLKPLNFYLFSGFYFFQYTDRGNSSTQSPFKMTLYSNYLFFPARKTQFEWNN